MFYQPRQFFFYFPYFLWPNSIIGMQICAMRCNNHPKIIVSLYMCVFFYYKNKGNANITHLMINLKHIYRHLFYGHIHNFRSFVFVFFCLVPWNWFHLFIYFFFVEKRPIWRIDTKIRVWEKIKTTSFWRDNDIRKWPVFFLKYHFDWSQNWRILNESKIRNACNFDSATFAFSNQNNNKPFHFILRILRSHHRCFFYCIFFLFLSICIYMFSFCQFVCK